MKMRPHGHGRLPALDTPLPSVRTVAKIDFLDDHWLECRRGLRRAYSQAFKSPANPVVRPTEQWEENRIYLFGSVLPAGNSGYRMWYQTCSDRLRGPDKALVCVADSHDLVSWRKQINGFLPFRDQKKTNIVLKCSGPAPLYSPSIIFDERETDPAKRFKMLFWDSGRPNERRGGCVAFSPNGLRWRRHASNPVFCNPNDVLVTSLDPDGGYLCYQTLLVEDTSQDHPRDNLRGRRRIIGLRTSGDFVNWSESKPILSPDDSDPADAQFYGMAVHREGDLWIGLLWTYRAGSQTSDVQLAWSRDGRRWQRPRERRPLIPLGDPRQFDCGLIFTASSPVELDGRIHILYGGFDGPHDSRTRSAAIGLASLRRDGWCALAAGDEWGELTTTPLPFPPQTLRLNIDASSGCCAGEIIDVESGAPLPGCSLHDSIPIQDMNSLAARLRWQSTPHPSPEPGAWALRLRLRNANLYAVKAP